MILTPEFSLDHSQDLKKIFEDTVELRQELIEDIKKSVVRDWEEKEKLVKGEDNGNGTVRD